MTATEKQWRKTDIALHAGVNVDRCYQCGKCSAGCALNQEMDIPPSMVMRMLQTGEQENYDRILESESIWLCLSCQNCLSRCPMEIDMPRLMDYLRETSLRKGVAGKGAKDIISFHRAFLDSVRYTGRLYEIGLVAGYKLRTFHILQDMDVAPAMFFKGKLPLLPEMVKSRKRLKAIFSETLDNAEGQAATGEMPVTPSRPEPTFTPHKQ